MRQFHIPADCVSNILRSCKSVPISVPDSAHTHAVKIFQLHENKNPHMFIFFRIILQYQIEWTSVQRVWSCHTRKNGRTDRQIQQLFTRTLQDESKSCRHFCTTACDRYIESPTSYEIRLPATIPSLLQNYIVWRHQLSNKTTLRLDVPKGCWWRHVQPWATPWGSQSCANITSKVNACGLYSWHTCISTDAHEAAILVHCIHTLRSVKFKYIIFTKKQYIPHRKLTYPPLQTPPTCGQNVKLWC